MVLGFLLPASPPQAAVHGTHWLAHFLAAAAVFGHPRASPARVGSNWSSALRIVAVRCGIGLALLSVGVLAFGLTLAPTLGAWLLAPPSALLLLHARDSSADEGLALSVVAVGLAVSMGLTAWQTVSRALAAAMLSSFSSTSELLGLLFFVAGGAAGLAALWNAAMAPPPPFFDRHAMLVDADAPQGSRSARAVLDASGRHRPSACPPACALGWAASRGLRGPRHRSHPAATMRAFKTPQATPGRAPRRPCARAPALAP